MWLVVPQMAEKEGRIKPGGVLSWVPMGPGPRLDARQKDRKHDRPSISRRVMTLGNATCDASISTSQHSLVQIVGSSQSIRSMLADVDPQPLRPSFLPHGFQQERPDLSDQRVTQTCHSSSLPVSPCLTPPEFSLPIQQIKHTQSKRSE